MDAEHFKKKYNENYKKKVDKWSDHNIKYTDLIIERIVKYIEKHDFKVSSDKKSLDIGCAKGHHTESLRKFGFDSYGLDYSDVAIEIAKKNFPKCKFFIMDGFNPQLHDKYSLIFMKAFSGSNTHDLLFVSNMCNKYIENLTDNGWFIMSFSTNFSGHEMDGETVNWTFEEIKEFSLKIKHAKLIDIKYFSYSHTKRLFRKVLNFCGIKRKDVFYLMFQK